jgi:hypothetical protein
MGDRMEFLWAIAKLVGGVWIVWRIGRTIYESGIQEGIREERFRLLQEEWAREHPEEWARVQAKESARKERERRWRAGENV